MKRIIVDGFQIRYSDEGVVLYDLVGVTQSISLYRLEKQDRYAGCFVNLELPDEMRHGLYGRNQTAKGMTLEGLKIYLESLVKRHGNRATANRIEAVIEAIERGDGEDETTYAVSSDDPFTALEQDMQNIRAENTQLLSRLKEEQKKSQDYKVKYLAAQEQLDVLNSKLKQISRKR